VEEVKPRMNRDPRFWVRQGGWIIYNALIAPRKAEEIAKHTGVSVPTLRRVISGYNRLGLAALETPGKGGRRHGYLTVEHEQEFGAPFFARAERGEIATAGEIKRVFEAQVGHEVEESTIYRLLHRHRWRKLVPRPRQPKANGEEHTAFKKTSQQASRRPKRAVNPPISDRCCRWPKMRVALAAAVKPAGAGLLQAFAHDPPDK
jgi:transposase